MSKKIYIDKINLLLDEIEKDIERKVDPDGLVRLQKLSERLIGLKESYICKLSGPMKQREIAELIDVSQSTISAIIKKSK